MSLYTEVIAAGCKIDHHYSDLYVQYSQTSAKIIATYNERHGHKPIHGVFTSQIDGQLWFDIPFAYDPFWEGIANGVRQQGRLQ